MECMRTVASLLATLLLAASGEAQQRGIDVKWYGVDLTLPDSGCDIRGNAVIAIARRGPADSVLALNLVGMNVDTVMAPYIGPTRRTAAFTYDDSVLRIHLPPSPPALVIWVRYHGTPQDGLIIGRNTHGRRVVFADNWPQRARYWLPTIDHPSDKAMARFSIVAPAGWRVVANGVRKRTDTEVDYWDEKHPIPVYTMVIGAGEFTVSTHRPEIVVRPPPRRGRTTPWTNSDAAPGVHRRAGTGITGQRATCLAAAGSARTRTVSRWIEG